MLNHILTTEEILKLYEGIATEDELEELHSYLANAPATDNVIARLRDKAKEKAEDGDKRYLKIRKALEQAEPAMREFICCICGKEVFEFGNNPDPVLPSTDEDGNLNECCDECNRKIVIPEKNRITRMVHELMEYGADVYQPGYIAGLIYGTDDNSEEI